MTTPISKRPVPTGFQLEYDASIWNVGHVFRWSEAYQNYLADGVISMRPDESIDEAFARAYDMPQWPEYEVFFASGT